MCDDRRTSKIYRKWCLEITVFKLLLRDYEDDHDDDDDNDDGTFTVALSTFSVAWIARPTLHHYAANLEDLSVFSKMLNISSSI